MWIRVLIVVLLALALYSLDCPADLEELTPDQRAEVIARLHEGVQRW